jgi:DNA-binding GntR family transcriptional regulator
MAGRRVLRYQQVMNLLERIIAEQGLAAGDRLPTHGELARLAGVSLISVRRALDELEREGRVVRHQGVGTFVASPRIVSDPGAAGGLLATLTDGEGPPEVRTHLVGIERAVAGPAIARVLGLGEAPQVWSITRLRLIRERPMIAERAVLPVSLVPALDEADLAAGGSLYGFLASRYGLTDEYEEQYLEVARPTAGERRLLGLPAGAQVARLRGVSFSSGGVAFDCFEHAYPAAGFGFYVSGRTRRHVVHACDVRDWEVIRRAPGRGREQAGRESAGPAASLPGCRGG